MSAAKHTPGPWLLDDENGIVAGNQVIAYAKAISHPILRKVDVEQWNANASLIAAAPDMLAALQHVASGKSGYRNKVLAAIAKAEGVQ